MFEEGTLQYDFIHTFDAINIFLDAQFDLAELGAGWTQEQVFRIVIIPGEFVNGRTAGKGLDYNNYEAVAKFFNIKESDVKKLELK